MTAHSPTSQPESTFTAADRATLHNSADKIQAIYNCVFGSPENPNNSLTMQVDRNTRFRISASKVLLALVPTVLMIIFYLIHNSRR